MVHPGCHVAQGATGAAGRSVSGLTVPGPLRVKTPECVRSLLPLPLCRAGAEDTGLAVSPPTTAGGTTDLDEEKQ